MCSLQSHSLSSCNSKSYGLWETKLTEVAIHKCSIKKWFCKIFANFNFKIGTINSRMYFNNVFTPLLYEMIINKNRK